MVQIEEYPAKDKRDLLSRERHWIETLKASLNQRIPGRNKKESGKIYYQNNADKFKASQKIYYEKNIDKSKVYYQKNADKIKDKNKVYYEKNADKIKAKRKVPFECGCGSVIQTTTKAVHFRTKKHLYWQKIHDFIVS
jgi:hypothetical protein